MSLPSLGTPELTASYMVLALPNPRDPICKYANDIYLALIYTCVNILRTLKGHLDPQGINCETSRNTPIGQPVLGDLTVNDFLSLTFGGICTPALESISSSANAGIDDNALAPVCTCSPLIYN